MIKHLKKSALTLLVVLSVSCAADKTDNNETNKVSSNPEQVWAYDGENTVLKNVITELKNGSYRASLERRLSKNEVLWKHAQFLYIEGEKRILVPFLSTDKENVIGVLTLMKNDQNQTYFDMTVRTQLKSKNIKFPFWNKGTWMGYFMALDKNVVGVKNGNPGLNQKKISSEKFAEIFGTTTSKSLKDCAQRYTGVTVSFYIAEEQCDENGESTFCYYFTTIVYVPVFEEYCWDDGVPPPPIPPLPEPVFPTDPNYTPGSLSYGGMNFTETTFRAYVNTETYSISSPVIINTYGEGAISKFKIASSVFAYDIEIELLLNRNAATPYYYVNGVSPNITNIFAQVNPGAADHWMESYNEHYEGSTLIVNYEGQNRYNLGHLLYLIPVKYKISLNSHTGQILSVERIED